MSKRLKIRPVSVFFSAAFVMLIGGLVFGLMSSLEYIFPQLRSVFPEFSTLRPLHTSSVIFWILLGASACVYYGLKTEGKRSVSNIAVIVHAGLWIICICGVFYAYATNDMGGREYWEFNPMYAMPLALAWLVFVFSYFRSAGPLNNKPVYFWMWMTGIVFFVFIFAENYLWLLPYYQTKLIPDMAVQWKVNGSIVGAWNQILYGTAFFLMDKICKDKRVGTGKLAFAMYFLGLFNLMFNWGHHIYTLPVPSYVRYTGYLVSMTEWIFFLRIVYTWKQSMRQNIQYKHIPAYRFIFAADIWVFINMGQAILMSIPALNLYTHGTHVTVAHAMGTTIGINTMILLAAASAYIFGTSGKERFSKRSIRMFMLLQAALLVFYLSLDTAGVLRGLWQMETGRLAFSVMMSGLQPFFIVFVISGTVLLISLVYFAVLFLKRIVLGRIEADEFKSESDTKVYQEQFELQNAR